MSILPSPVSALISCCIVRVLDWSSREEMEAEEDMKEAG